MSKKAKPRPARSEPLAGSDHAFRRAYLLFRHQIDKLRRNVLRLRATRLHDRIGPTFDPKVDLAIKTLIHELELKQAKASLRSSRRGKVIGSAKRFLGLAAWLAFGGM